MTGLAFYTKSQHFLIEDPNGTILHPSQDMLQSGSSYTIKFFIENFDTTAYPGVSVVVRLNLCGFGFGTPSSAFSSKTIAIDGAVDGDNPTIAEVDVLFQVPQVHGGQFHGCLFAYINDGKGNELPNCVQQNLNISTGFAGQAKGFTFFVWNMEAQDHNYEILGPIEEYVVTDTDRIGSPATANTSWPIQLLRWDGSPAALNTNIPIEAQSWHAYQLIVTIPGHLPAGVSRERRIVVKGLTEGRQNIVEQFVKAEDAPSVQYNVYIEDGTYYSPDILLQLPYPPNLAYPLFTDSGTNIQKLLPDQDYSFVARIHNATQDQQGHDIEATGTRVDFYFADGGTGWNRVLIDSVSDVSIPAASSRLVAALKPFRSAPAGEHRCAIVQISNSNCPGCNGTDPEESNPVSATKHAAAQLNTDTMNLHFPIRDPRFHINLQLAFPIHVHLPPNPGPLRVALTVTARKVSRDWARSVEKRKLARQIALTSGLQNIPLYALEDLRAQLPTADMNLELKLRPCAHASARLENDLNATAKQPVAIHAPVTVPTPYEVIGSVPKDAQEGDVYLVEVAAQYPDWGRLKGRTIKFLEVIRIGNPPHDRP